MGIPILKRVPLRHRLGATLFGLMISATNSAAQDGSVYLIANSSVKLSPAQAEDAFIGDLEFAEHTRLVLFDNRQAYRHFANRVLAMEANRYRTLWVKKSFREALIPPTMTASDLETLLLIKNTPGAIGYTTSIDADVFVIKEY